MARSARSVCRGCLSKPSTCVHSPPPAPRALAGRLAAPALPPRGCRTACPSPGSSQTRGHWQSWPRSPPRSGEAGRVDVACSAVGRMLPRISWAVVAWRWRLVPRRRRECAQCAARTWYPTGAGDPRPTTMSWYCSPEGSVTLSVLPSEAAHSASHSTCAARSRPGRGGVQRCPRGPLLCPAMPQQCRSARVRQDLCLGRCAPRGTRTFTGSIGSAASPGCAELQGRQQAAGSSGQLWGA